jgi:hypothetical protein
MAERLVRLHDESLDGVVVADGSLFLHLGSGEVWELRGSPELSAAGVAIVSRACLMREVTRQLRGIGARRGKPGSDHDQFFEPLMAARRQAEGAATAAERLAVFDSGAIRGAMESAMHAFSNTRYASDAPRRRALYEMQWECAEPVFTRLEELAAAATAVRVAPAEMRLARWRDWQHVLDLAFAAAVVAWLSIIPLLNVATDEPPTRLRRFFQRKWL